MTVFAIKMAQGANIAGPLCGGLLSKLVNLVAEENLATTVP
jgi:hypothetical protein